MRHLIRPIDELRSRDLDLNFLWAFADEFEGLPGQDETSVFPVSADLIPLKGFYGFAAADFIGPEGKLFTGLVQVDTLAHSPASTSGDCNRQKVCAVTHSRPQTGG
jgi:hypothetical protein